MKIPITVGCWLLAAGLWAQAPGQLTVTVNNIDPVEGELYIAIYSDADTYMDLEKTAFQKVVDIKSATEIVKIENVPGGEYAVTVFQDLNANGELDTRGFGIPKEPYGFSNDARGSLGPPKFKTAKFSFSGNLEITITLVNEAKK